MADENQPGKETGADAKTEGADAKTEGADAKTADAKTEGTDAKAAGTDAKTEGTDAKTEGAVEATAGTQTLTDLADLRQAVEGPPPPEIAAVVEPKLDAQGRAYATGKRKDAVARVWIQPGNGAIIVNGRDWESYFARPVLRMLIGQPLAAANRTGQYDVKCTVKGGGLSGQAGAVRHGVAKALSLFEPALRPTLKTGGFLTRDSRVVERKKYGRHKARRSHQFSKR